MVRRFYTFSERERIAFESMVDKFRKLYENREQVMYYHLTTEPTQHFDLIMHIYSKQGIKIESNIIEIKVRNTHYNLLLLEKKKYDYLKELEKKELEVFKNVNILYLNFTPKGTYLFNLNKVNINWEVGEYNKSYVLDQNKVEKKVAKLDILEANDCHHIFDRDTTNIKMLNKLNKQQAYKCMFASIKNLK